MTRGGETTQNNPGMKSPGNLVYSPAAPGVVAWISRPRAVPVVRDLVPPDLCLLFTLHIPSCTVCPPRAAAPSAVTGPIVSPVLTGVLSPTLQHPLTLGSFCIHQDSGFCVFPVLY